MLILESVTSPRIAYWLVQGLSLFRAPNPVAQLNSWLEQDWGTGARTLFTPVDDATPACFAAFKDGNTLILVDGATTLTQASMFIEGFGVRADIRTSNVDNLYVTDVARRLGARLAAFGFVVQANMFWAGYSLGGVVAERFAQAAALSNVPALTQRVWTIGSPRFAGQEECVQLATGASVVRWFNAEDPVPLIPPRLSEQPTLPLFYTPRQIAFLGRFLHPAIGLNIGSAGTISAEMVPTSASVSFSTSLLNWFLSIIQDDANFHSLQTYGSRLGGIVAANPPNPPLPDRTRDQPEVPTTQQIDRAETQAATTVRTIERTQNAAVVNVPNLRTVHAVRIGKLYYLIFGGVTIACPGTRRRARGLARQLNNFLLNLQSVAIVDPTALLEALREYLRSATDAASEFRPTMNTRV